MFVVKVDVIIAIHNGEATIEETVRSALNQEIPPSLIHPLRAMANSANARGHRHNNIHFDICVCCYDDASTDRSLEILLLGSLEKQRTWKYASSDNIIDADGAITDDITITVHTRLLIGSAPIGTSSRGAGYARNQAVKLREKDAEGPKCLASDECQENDAEQHHHFLCILDSDDIMHSTRIAEQTCAMLSLSAEQRDKTLMGCQFDRIPKDSTYHYSQWANSLSDERLHLEKFRECTLVRIETCHRTCFYA